MEFLTEYGIFFAKAVTLVLAIIFVIGFIAAQKQANRQHESIAGQMQVRKLNQRFEQFEQILQEQVLSDKAFKKVLHDRKKADKKAQKDSEDDKPRIFYVDFEGDIEASEVEKLRHEISAILTIATSGDEVVVNVDSAGGMVHTYGLAASQLQRLRDANIALTVCVDKVAASGGYLMACVADKILAAPFAIIGSIGVLAQIPNFNRALKRFDVDYEVLTAGEYKAPVTMFGELTDKGRNKLQQDLEDTHQLFKGFIAQHRPQVDLAHVATGEVWYGSQAIEQHLIDGIITSDDYLMQQYKNKDIFEISFVEKKSLQEKLGFAVQHSVLAAFKALMKQERNAHFASKV